jgi:hypothetical protein
MYLETLKQLDKDGQPKKAAKLLTHVDYDAPSAQGLREAELRFRIGRLFISENLQLDSLLTSRPEVMKREVLPVLNLGRATVRFARYYDKVNEHTVKFREDFNQTIEDFKTEPVRPYATIGLLTQRDKEAARAALKIVTQDKPRDINWIVDHSEKVRDGLVSRLLDIEQTPSWDNVDQGEIVRNWNDTVVGAFESTQAELEQGIDWLLGAHVEIDRD